MWIVGFPYDFVDDSMQQTLFSFLERSVVLSLLIPFSSYLPCLTLFHFHFHFHFLFFSFHHSCGQGPALSPTIARTFKRSVDRALETEETRKKIEEAKEKEEMENIEAMREEVDRLHSGL